MACLSPESRSLCRRQGACYASSRDAARLRRLHAQACRLAETKPKILTHPEVARAIEQGLLLPLVTCLTAAKVQENGAVKRHQPE